MKSKLMPAVLRGLLATGALVITLTTQASQTCTSDAECAQTQACIKIDDDFDLQGQCKDLVNSYGAHELNEANAGITLVKGCSATIECNTGFVCTKAKGALAGSCEKE